MSKRSSRPELPKRAILEQPSAESLGLDSVLGEPEDDGGISLEELGQTYAALLSKGADPLPEEAGDPLGEPTAEESNWLALEATAQGEGVIATTLELVRKREASPVRVVDGDDEAGCEIMPRTILEAILFVGHPLNEPLTSKQIAGLMRGVTADEVEDLIGELNEAYQAEGCPYRIRSSGAGYLMQLLEAFSNLRDKFYGRIKEARLSQQAIDVLAVVAYNQPLTVEEIDRLRGRSSGSIVSQLVRRDLLALVRAGEAGSKPTFHTTERFLDLYGLDNLGDLPQAERNS